MTDFVISGVAVARQLILLREHKAYATCALSSSLALWQHVRT
jgi:hypothetical protein